MAPRRSSGSALDGTAKAIELRVSTTNAGKEGVMWELTPTRTTREDAPDSPVEIHCLDIQGSRHLFSERNGILFFEGGVDNDICVPEEASQYSTYVQDLTYRRG